MGESVGRIPTPEQMAQIRADAREALQQIIEEYQAALRGEGGVYSYDLEIRRSTGIKRLSDTGYFKEPPLTAEQRGDTTYRRSNIEKKDEEYIRTMLGWLQEKGDEADTAE